LHRQQAAAIGAGVVQQLIDFGEHLAGLAGRALATIGGATPASQATIL
jgi:hypothetical protein